MLITRLLLLLCALLFILLQGVDVKVIGGERLSLKISFNILALVLTEEEIKKLRPKGFGKILKNLGGILKSAKYLISHSIVTVTKIDNESPFIGDDAPWLILTFGRLILDYLEANSRAFRTVFTDTSMTNNELGGYAFDISFHFSLLRMIISASILLYYIVKTKAKRVIKNV